MHFKSFEVFLVYALFLPVPPSSFDWILKMKQPIEHFYYFARIVPSLVAVWRVVVQETVWLIKGK